MTTNATTSTRTTNATGMAQTRVFFDLLLPPVWGCTLRFSAPVKNTCKITIARKSNASKGDSSQPTQSDVNHKGDPCSLTQLFPNNFTTPGNTTCTCNFGKAKMLKGLGQRLH